MNLTSLLELAGLMHAGLLWAGTTMLFKVKLREHLTPLPQFIRRLFWVYYSFIGLMLIGFGTLMVSSERGLVGLGLILTLGVGCSMLSALVLLPAALHLRRRKADSADAPAEPLRLAA